MMPLFLNMFLKNFWTNTSSKCIGTQKHVPKHVPKQGPHFENTLCGSTHSYFHWGNCNQIVILSQSLSHWSFGLIPFFFWPGLQYHQNILSHYLNHQNILAMFSITNLFTNLIFHHQIHVPFLYHQNHLSNCGQETTKSPNFALFHQNCVDKR